MLFRSAEAVLRAKDDAETDQALQASDAEREAATLLKQEQREAFFDALPPDGFTPDEEAMRDALLDIMSVCEHVSDTFDTAVKDFRAKQPAPMDADKS